MAEINLGRLKVHDPKSRNYAVQAAPVAGRSVRWAMNSRNVDQFYTSGCVGFSGTNLLNCGVAVRSRRMFNGNMRSQYLDNDDGLLNYHNSTLFDPFDWIYPPTDGGSSALGLMKWWAMAGIISGYDWAFNFDQFLAALQRQPVLVGTWWYDSMFNPDANGVIAPSGEQVGGHEYLANAVLWNKKLIGFENSWGESWGVKGRFYMTFDAVEALLADGGDVAVPRLA